jgi:hypothetical protein
MNIRQIIREELEGIINTDIHGKKSSPVDYTAVVVEGDEIAKFELQAFEVLRKHDISIPMGWFSPNDYHMTITKGPLGLGQQMAGAIGAEIELTIVSIGVSDDAISFGVKGMYSRNKNPHITFSFRRDPKDSNEITRWIGIEPFKAKGYIREVDKKDGWGRLNQIDENIRMEVKKVLLSENQKPLPRQFDHLKWRLSNNQKYYLQDLCEVDPNSITTEDVKHASKFLGIPEKNVKSILNTYSTYDPMSEAVFEGDPKSPFKLGNKPVTVGDVLSAKEANRAPVRANRTTWPTQDTVTPAYRKTMSKAQEKNMILDKGGHYNNREKYYEGLKTSLMMYLFCEVNPKNIALNHRGQIQVDQEPILMEGETFNMENHTFRKIKVLLKSFNKLFECNFRISEHVDLSESQGCHRTMVELFGIASDKWYWDEIEFEWVKPGDLRYEHFKKKYIENDGMAKPMPEVPVVNHKEMLQKYFNGDLISYNPNADWLL